MKRTAKCIVKLKKMYFYSKRFLHLGQKIFFKNWKWMWNAISNRKASNNMKLELLKFIDWNVGLKRTQTHYNTIMTFRSLINIALDLTGCRYYVYTNNNVLGSVQSNSKFQG